MDIAVVTKSICVYKDYEVRLLEVQNVRVGGAVGEAVGGAVGEAVGSFKRVNRDVEG